MDNLENNDHSEHKVPNISDHQTNNTDSDNWKGGFIYSNKDDPREWVPRQHGRGYTMNFGGGNWKPIVAGISVLLVPIIVMVIAIAFLSHK